MPDKRPLPRLSTTPAADLSPLQAALGADYPEIWCTIAECLYIGLPTDPAVAALDVAQRVALAITLADVLRAHLGGQQPYLPVGTDYESTLKYRKLYARFNGRNLIELQPESGVTARHLYRIFEAMRREELARRQRGFNFEDAA